ncbi:MAG: hypothetical protein ACM3PU_08110 [Gemmatimonadota bacterium]
MNEILKLAEQHVREWESRLKHIDELMERASQAHANAPSRQDIEAKLAQMRESRNKLAQELEIMRQKRTEESHEVIAHSTGLKGAFELLSKELYDTLMAAPKARGE